MLERAAGAPALLQRQPEGKKGSEEAGWAELVKAVADARARNDRARTIRALQNAVVAAAKAVTPPPGVTMAVPDPADIRIDLTLDAFAMTQPPKDPDAKPGPWSWVSFSPTAVLQTRAHTEAIITHELTHVGQWLGLWAQHKRGALGKGTWEQIAKSLAGDVTREVEAWIISIGFLDRLEDGERRSHMRQLLGAYADAVDFLAGGGTARGLAPSQAKPRILAAFDAGSGGLKDIMGTELWGALIERDASAARAGEVLRDLAPLALHGYRRAPSRELRKLFDEFLAARRLAPDGSARGRGKP
jgi:hypothetical protein